MNGDKFNRGDFLKKDNKKGSFMIYEGNNLSESVCKKMSLLCFFDPEKFEKNDMGIYEQTPRLYIGDMTKPCSETIDTEEEDFWVKKCTVVEKALAINTLKTYGYTWLEKTMELVETETGKVVRKIKIPDNTYHGEVIHPIKDEFKKLMMAYCINKNKTPSYNYANQYFCDNYYD